jgi:hypothetical protein
MFRPPTALIQKKLKAYYKLHQEPTPEWVFAIDYKEAMIFLEFCNKLHWKLPKDILVKGELFNGTDSVWSDQANSWDTVSNPDPLKNQS